MIDLSIIIPVRDEAKRLYNCLGKLTLFLPRQPLKSEVIISADSCSDNTVAIVEEESKHTSFPLRLLYSPVRLGKGGAIREAVKASSARYVLFLDVDIPVDLRFIGDLMKYAEEYDIVNGSRFLKGSVRTDPLVRRILSWGYHSLCRLLLKIPYDTQCGLKLCRRAVAEEVFEYVVTDGFSFDTEFMVQAERHGYRVHEVAVTWIFDRNTPFKASFLLWRMLGDLLAIKLRAMKASFGNRKDMVGALNFYNSVSGDVRWRASQSLLLPRRLWYKIKDDRIFDSIEAVGRQAKNLRILDVGCGSGILLNRLWLNGYHDVHGIDISFPAVEFANKILGHKLVLWADASKPLPFESGTFDVLVASEVIEHLPDFEAALLEFHRILKKKGCLLITAPRPGIRWDLLEVIWSRLRHEQLEFDHAPLSPTRTMWGLVKSGFTVRKFEPFLFGCELFVEAEKN